jgi:hypothetical protein
VKHLLLVIFLVWIAIYSSGANGTDGGGERNPVVRPMHPAT